MFLFFFSVVLSYSFFFITSIIKKKIKTKKDEFAIILYISIPTVSYQELMVKKLSSVHLIINITFSYLYGGYSNTHTRVYTYTHDGRRRFGSVFVIFALLSLKPII